MKTKVTRKTVKLVDDWSKLTEEGEFKPSGVQHEKLCNDFYSKFSKSMILKCGIINKSIEAKFYCQLQISGKLNGLYHPQNRSIERFFKKYKRVILSDDQRKTIEKRAYEYDVKCLYYFNNTTNTHRILMVLIAEKIILERVLIDIKKFNGDRSIMGMYVKEIKEKAKLINSYKEDLGEEFIKHCLY